MVKGRKLDRAGNEAPQQENGEHEISVEAFHKAATDGFPGAQYFLGLAYREGCQVEPSLREAYFWFRMAEHSATELLGQTRSYADELKKELAAEDSFCCGIRRKSELFGKEPV